MASSSHTPSSTNQQSGSSSQIPTSNPRFPHLPAALTANIHNSVPIKLTDQDTNYNIWKRMFIDTCESYSASEVLLGTSHPLSPTDTEWLAMNATIKRWFYATIDIKLLKNINLDNSDAHSIWTKIEANFTNNKPSRAMHLNEKFRNLQKGDLTITQYCQEMKTIADTLADLDHPISEQAFLLQLLQGLPESYLPLITVLTTQKPTPQFDEVRNLLLLHESRENRFHNSENSDSHSALLSQTPYQTHFRSTPSNRGQTRFFRGRGNGRNSGRIFPHHSRSQRNSHGNSSHFSNFQQPNYSRKGLGPGMGIHFIQYTPQGPKILGPANSFVTGSNFRPAASIGQSSPTSPAAFFSYQQPTETAQFRDCTPRPAASHLHQSGQADASILGPAPNHLQELGLSYANNNGPSATIHNKTPSFFGPTDTKTAASFFGPINSNFDASDPNFATPAPPDINSSQQPTDLAALFSSMSLQQPDENWYLDTGASAHMTNSSGS